MTPEAQLLAAIGALWAVVTALGGGGFKFLIDDRKAIVAAWEKRLEEEQAACDARITTLEAKLDASAGIITRQTEAMQRQIDAQSTLLAQQQQMIAALQSLSRGGPP